MTSAIAAAPQGERNQRGRRSSGPRREVASAAAAAFRKRQKGRDG